MNFLISLCQKKAAGLKKTGLKTTGFQTAASFIFYGMLLGGAIGCVWAAHRPQFQARQLQTDQLQAHQLQARRLANSSKQQASAGGEELVDGLELMAHYKPWNTKKHPITVGVEIEAIVPKKITNPKWLALIAQKLKRAYPRLEVVRTSSNTLQYKTSPRSPVHEYQTKEDVSIHYPEGYRGVELVSPVLSKPRDLQSFYQIIKSLATDGGGVPAPLSAGVHVHIGFRKASDEELSFLTWLLASVEKQVYSKFQVFHTRKKYANPTSAHVKDAYKEKIKTYKSQDPLCPTDELLKKTVPISSVDLQRCRGLNLQAFDRQQTVEFRYFNSTLNVAKIEGFIRFAKGVSTAVRTQDPRLIQFLKQHPQHIDLEALLQALGIDIDFQLFNYEPELQKFYSTYDQAILSRSTDREHLLAESIRFGDVGLVRSLLNMGVSPLGPREEVVLNAVRSGRVEILKLLTSQSDIEPLAYSFKVLVKLALSKSPEMFRHIVESLNLNMETILSDPEFISYWMNAHVVRWDEIDFMFSQAEQLGANIENVLQGEHWLWQVVKNEQVQEFRYLISRGARFYVFEGDDKKLAASAARRLIIMALEAWSIELFKELIQQGVVKHLSSPWLDVEMFEALLPTPHRAKDRIAMLLEAGLQVHQDHKIDYAIRVLERKQNYEVLEVLFQDDDKSVHQLKQEINKRPELISTATFQNALYESFQVRHLLLQWRPEAVTQEVLQRALKAGRNETLAQLADARPDLVTDKLIQIAEFDYNYDALRMLKRLKKQVEAPSPKTTEHHTKSGRFKGGLIPKNKIKSCLEYLGVKGRP